VLRPEDDQPVLHHQPGQYLTLWIDIPGQHPLKRNYSISGAPNGRTYRISVKREPQGIASTWLHDAADVGTALKVAPPAGEFFLNEESPRPVVLLSGGVGLTPMMSMLETIAARYPNKAVYYVHGTLNGATHAMKDRVRAFAETCPNIRATTFYVEPRPEDRLGADYDHEGLITMDWLRANTPLTEAGYYLCGPRPFLQAFVGGLALAGVRSSRIHYEYFGPADEILTAA
jgi:nitric oxide dioxygenase